MPDVGLGILSYPGTDAYRGEFTLGHGTTPSMGTIACTTVDGRRLRRGTLTLGSEGQDTIRLRDCKPGRIDQQIDANGGVTVTVQLFDRRAWWADHPITGEYNAPATITGTATQVNVVSQYGFEAGTEKTPQELATLLFQAMGEMRADVSALPNDARPHLLWDDADADVELQQLVESLNCRVILTPDDRVKIKRLNEGQPVPDNDFVYEAGDGIDWLEPPNIIEAVGAPTLYQVRLPLKPVGEEIDGRALPIDELSYKPRPGGWEKEDPNILPSIPEAPTPTSGGAGTGSQIIRPDGTRTSTRELATGSVYRWYQVELNGLKIPGFYPDEPTRTIEVERRQILPLGNVLAETYRDIGGVDQPKRAFVAGKFFHVGRPEFKNSPQGTKIEIPFSIDAARAIVQFGQAVYRVTKDGELFLPAELFLYVAVQVKRRNRVAERHRKRKTLVAFAPRGTPSIRTLRHDDIQRKIIAKYSANSALTNPLIGVTDNLTTVDQQCDYYLNAAEQALRLPPNQLRPMAGIHAIEPDGAIQQVTWSVVGGQGSFTQISRGYEASLNVPSYRENRDRENRRKIAALVKAAAAEKKIKGKKSL